MIVDSEHGWLSGCTTASWLSVLVGITCLLMYLITRDFELVQIGVFQMMLGLVGMIICHRWYNNRKDRNELRLFQELESLCLSGVWTEQAGKPYLLYNGTSYALALHLENKTASELRAMANIMLAGTALAPELEEVMPFLSAVVLASTRPNGTVIYSCQIQPSSELDRTDVLDKLALKCWHLPEEMLAGT